MFLLCHQYAKRRVALLYASITDDQCHGSHFSLPGKSDYYAALNISQVSFPFIPRTKSFKNFLIVSSNKVHSASSEYIKRRDCRIKKALPKVFLAHLLFGISYSRTCLWHTSLSTTDIDAVSRLSFFIISINPNFFCSCSKDHQIA